MRRVSDGSRSERGGRGREDWKYGETEGAETVGRVSRGGFLWMMDEGEESGTDREEETKMGNSW